MLAEIRCGDSGRRGSTRRQRMFKQNRNLVVNFLKGYMEGIHYMLRRKDESLKVLYKLLSKFRHGRYELSV